MKAAIEKLIGSASERAGQRIERARADLARIEASLAELRVKRDGLLLEDSPQAVVASVRNEVRALERERGDLLENLEAAQRALAKAGADAAARALAAKWKRTAELCGQRQAAATRLEAAILEAAAAFNAVVEVTSEINGCVPIEQPTRTLNPWHIEARSVANGFLCAITKGQLGDPESNGIYQPREWLKRTQSVRQVIERQHRQLLAQQQPALTETKAAA